MRKKSPESKEERISPSFLSGGVRRYTLKML